MYETCRMGNLGVKEEPHPSPHYWDKATPHGHIWVIAVIFTSVLSTLWFSYLCYKRVCNYTVTPASLNQNWAWCQEFIFWLLFWNSNHFPKETFWTCSFLNFPMKICLTPLSSPVLLWIQVQCHWVADGNVLGNVEIVARWRKKQGWSGLIPWHNSSVNSSRKYFLIPPPPR